jgi:hypothetical protein
MGIIIALAILWLALVVVGFIFKAVLWLAIIGVVLFIITAAFGVFHSVKRN